MALGGENSEDSRNVHSEREWSNEMREDDLDYIDNDQNENILLDELEIEKRLKKLKYDYTKETASKALFKACQIGRTEIVTAIINDTAADINCKDKWDSTPLYYACLCGHIEIVKILLNNGAKCAPSTFEGERCLYGALTNDIKDLLVAASQINSNLMSRDEFSEHMRRLYEGIYTDFTIKCIGGALKCHKFVLASRIRFFKAKFAAKWKDKNSIICKIPIDYMQYLLEYLYTAQCSIPVSELDDVSRYASQLKMHDFVDLLNHEFSVFTEWSKLKPTVSPIRSIDLFGDKEILKSDLLNSEHFDIELTNGFGDVIQGHRAVFLSRSDYFGALFTDHFHESDQSGESNEYFGKFSLPNVSENGLIALKSYCYTESFPEGLEEIDLIEVLEMSDYYMLPGMKKVITSYMLNYLQNHNVLDWLLRARLFNIGRLEERCLWHIASNFEYFNHDPDFDEIIVQDANSVLNRESEDSIEIVDELRFQFSKLPNSEYLNRLLDFKLDKLGIKTFQVFLN